jgi:hypothetical protein
MDVSGQTVSIGQLTAREKLQLEAGLVLERSGCFAEEIDLLFLPRFEIQIFHRIYWSLY